MSRSPFCLLTALIAAILAYADGASLPTSARTGGRAVATVLLAAVAAWRGL